LCRKETGNLNTSFLYTAQQGSSKPISFSSNDCLYEQKYFLILFIIYSVLSLSLYPIHDKHIRGQPKDTFASFSLAPPALHLCLKELSFLFVSYLLKYH